MFIVEVERRDDGDKEKVVVEINNDHGMASFHAQMFCQMMNKHVSINSSRYYKVVERDFKEMNEV